MKDVSGRIRYGFIEAEDKKSVRKKVNYPNQFIIGITTFDKKKLFSLKVKLDTLLMFTTRLSSLVNSGVHILRAIHILWLQTEDLNMQLVISYIRTNLEQGKSISESLEGFSSIFSKTYRVMVAVAERSGDLHNTLKKLTEHLNRQKAIITRTKKVTLYPAIVFTFAILVLFCMFVFVVPTFQKVLTQLKVELPLLTQIVIGISKVLCSPYFYAISIGLFVVLFTAYKAFQKNEKFIMQKDKYKLQTPLIGNLLYTIYLNRFIHAMSMMIASGVPIVESLDVSKTITNNAYISGNVEEVKNKVEQGSSIYNAFGEIKKFPVILIEMIGAGEAAGTIVKMLEDLSVHYDNEIDYKQSRLFTFLEPALIMFVGMIVIISLFAVYLPIFSVWDKLLQA